LIAFVYYKNWNRYSQFSLFERAITKICRLGFALCDCRKRMLLTIA